MQKVTLPPVQVRGEGTSTAPSLDKRRANLVRALARVRADIANRLEREGNLLASLEALDREEAAGG